MKRVLVLAFTAAFALAAAGAADARRPATSSERAAMGAAVLAWEKKDTTGQSQVDATKWAAKLECHFQKAYVSTVNTRWAVYWLRAKYPESDPRYQQCTRRAGYVEGVWVLKRSASGAWAVTGYIWGERSGYCSALAATGIPLAAFNDAHGPGLGTSCKP